MADHLQPEERSRNMAAVRSKNTQPELALRRLVHGMGYRYRLHSAHIPGKPDLVFASRRCVIFLHGCFWHRHRSCRFATEPKTNVDFWTRKFRANMERDKRTNRELRSLGYRVLVVWQCDLKAPEKLADRIRRFLDAGAGTEG